MARQRDREPDGDTEGDTEGNTGSDMPAAGDPLCPLCDRPIPPGVPQSLHHLVPKLKGGRHGPVILLHQICHSEIHATLTEGELARAFHTINALRANPRLAAFIAWVSRRPPGFLSRTSAPERRRRER